ncbi:MAG: hypothetical protein IKV15_01645 [Bacteroidaceae bacterium]|nr:hypothetical protein [Bacteroidaceae bacterium]
MKKNLFLLSVLVMFFTATTSIKAQTFDLPFVSYTPTFSVTQRNLRQVILDDGIYKLGVEYKSNSTNFAQYELEVRIQNDNVTHIYFGNDGYVHSGRNNSGYTWRGGGINWNVDFYGNITGGSAIIQVNYQGGRWQLFTINF